MRGGIGFANPDQHPAVLIHGDALGVDEFIRQGGECLVVELEAELQGPVRHPPLPLEEVTDLGQEGIEVHHCPSTCASVASAWGRQKVMPMA